MFRLRLLAIAFVLLALAWFAATAILFFFPREDAPRRANAVVVLSGDREHRLDKGLELMREAVAPVLVISDGWAAGWSRANRLCTHHTSGFVVLCPRPRPYSTRGEAETIARLAAARKWRSIIVVTSRYHVTRARMLFKRCFRGRVETVGASFDPLRIPEVVSGEWAKLIYALAVARTC